MIHENHKWDRVLEFLFNNSNKKFTVREISRKTKISTSTVQRYIKTLKKRGFIDKDNSANITPYFKLEKAFFIIEKAFETGLMDYLDSNFNPSLIVLFGSARKGEYDSESDIDIFIESVKTPTINLLSFEKKIGHKIELFIRKDIKDLPENLFNNILNGIKLGGYLKLK